MNPSSPKTLEVVDWGTLPYGEALRRQEALVEDHLRCACPDRLVLVEHPPVVTVGRSGGGDDLRVPEEFLRRAGIEVHHVDRGGRATAHGPGQLVVYPILRLVERDLHRYLERLLETVCTVLRGYGLAPELRQGRPGVWVDGAKIASVGIAVQRWVTYHGIALNVATDPSLFDCVVPCGNAAERITSLEGVLDRAGLFAEVRHRFVEVFREVFGYTPERPTAASLPPWLVRPAPAGQEVRRMEAWLRRAHLATVCEHAHCPNLGECFGRGTATFLILGDCCTRSCRFCAVKRGRAAPPDPEEPVRVARAVAELGLQHVVVTSVTRDDLHDGGAAHFARTVQELRKRCPTARVELLIPDLEGRAEALDTVLAARPDVLNHNVETVTRLYPKARPEADYRRSMTVLERASGHGLRTKSGLMLGLGESGAEVRETLQDLRRSGCSDVTLGQYLAPSKEHLPVARFVTPEEFEDWAETARALGFEGVASGPLVRSSYRAEALWARRQLAV